jgi:hypothetical protein
MANSKSWEKIFYDLKMDQHDFDREPFKITAKDIKKACQKFESTGEKEVRLLCKQDTRESRPDIFKENELFILPTKNGSYAVIKGEGYVDIPPVELDIIVYESKLDFDLITARVGDSEMQHLDHAYACSLIRSFIEDPSLVMTIRGRKFTPKFDFRVGDHTISVSSVQTEVDAGYEGRNQIVLVEAKNSKARNVVIRQLYYPFRQWQIHTNKKVTTLYFERSKEDVYSIWQFEFTDPSDYNSINLVRSGRFRFR